MQTNSRSHVILEALQKEFMVSGNEGRMCARREGVF